MSIVRNVVTMCKQTAVYWEQIGNDGSGGYIYADPVEIKCRWEDKLIMFYDDKGAETNAKAVLFVLQDLKYDSRVFLGRLSSLTIAQKADPMIVPTAYPIKRFDKSPVLRSTTEFIRKAFLTPYGGMS